MSKINITGNYNIAVGRSNLNNSSNNISIGYTSLQNSYSRMYVDNNLMNKIKSKVERIVHNIENKITIVKLIKPLDPLYIYQYLSQEILDESDRIIIIENGHFSYFKNNNFLLRILSSARMV